MPRTVEFYLSRIRMLEAGLATLQAAVSDQPHPLLKDAVLDNDGLTPDPKQTIDSDGLGQTMDALGTLTIGEGGQERYFGRSAGVEVFLP